MVSRQRSIYLSVIVNYPFVEEERELSSTESNFSWIMIVFNSRESNSFLAAGGVLCEASTSSANATKISQLPITEENQQEEQVDKLESGDTVASIQQELESEGGDMTAILNGDGSTPGDTIKVNGIVEERDSESFVTTEVIDPQNKTVESAILDNL
jgi:hypothetical protein